MLFAASSPSAEDNEWDVPVSLLALRQPHTLSSIAPSQSTLSLLDYVNARATIASHQIDTSSQQLDDVCDESHFAKRQKSQNAPRSKWIATSNDSDKDVHDDNLHLPPLRAYHETANVSEPEGDELIQDAVDDVRCGSPIAQDGYVSCQAPFATGRISPSLLDLMTTYIVPPPVSITPPCVPPTFEEPNEFQHPVGGLIIVAKPHVQRVSRCAGGGTAPSNDALEAARSSRLANEQLLRRRGIFVRALPPLQRTQANLGVWAGLGPSVVVNKFDQKAFDRISVLKRTLELSESGDPDGVMVCNDPPTLYAKATQYGAVGNALTNRASTEGAVIQHRRLNTGLLCPACASLVVANELVKAMVAASCRSETDVFYGNPIGWNAYNPAALLVGDTVQGSFIGMISTSSCLYNSMALRLGTSGVSILAEHIAKMEDVRSALSNEFGHPSTKPMLRKLTDSVLQKPSAPYDYAWACILLVTYVISNPRGRQLMPQSKFTDLDVRLAVAYARYAQTILTRQINYFRGKRRRVGNDRDGVDPVVSFDSDDGPVLRGASDGFDSTAHLAYWETALNHKYACAAMAFVCKDIDHATIAALQCINLQADQLKSDVQKVLLLQHLAENHVHSIWHATAPLVLAEQSYNYQSVVTACVSLTAEQRAALSVGSGASTTRWVGLKPSMQCEQIAEFGAYYVPSRIDFAPQDRTKMAIAWSIASQLGKDLTRSDDACPGLIEAVAIVSEHESHASAGANRKFGASGSHQRKHTELCRRLGDGYRPIATDLQAKPRSIIVTRRLVQLYATDVDAARELHRFVRQVVDKTVPFDTAPLLNSVDSIYDEMVPSILEPAVEPTFALTVGLRISEQLCKMLGSRTRHDHPCLVKLHDNCGWGTNSPIAQTTPIPVMPIVQVEIQFVDGLPSTQLGSREIAITHHVQTDQPIRLVDVMAQMASDVQAGPCRFYTARSLILGACIQASDVADIAYHMLPGQLINGIQCSHRSGNPDIGLLASLLLTDVFLVKYKGDPICEDTLYEGVYGPGFHHGMQSCGFGYCIHRFSDERCFAKCGVSQETTNWICRELGTRFYEHCSLASNGGESVPCEGRPPETCGIPHALYMGLHRALDPLKRAVDAVDAYSHRCNCSVGLQAAIDAILGSGVDDVKIVLEGIAGFSVFPYGQFTMNQSPNTATGLYDAASRMHTKQSRDGVDVAGRAKLLDSTAANESIFCDLFRRPTKELPADNPVNTVHEEIGQVLLSLSALSELAKLACHERRARGGKAPSDDLSVCGDEVVDALYDLLTRCHTGDDAVLPYYLASDAMRELNTIYATAWTVNQDVLLPVYAMWGQRCSKFAYEQCLAGTTPTGLSLCEACGSDAALLQEARHFWKAFQLPSKQCVWKNAIAPFLEMLVRWNGYHLTSLSQFAEARRNLENVVRFAYNVHAATLADGSLGRPPPDCPCADALGPHDLRRHHVDAHFVGFNGTLPRGPLCGIKPFQHRQLLTLTLGAEFAREVNVRRVLGHMEKSVAKAADIQSSDGDGKSFKGTNCLQVDRDMEAMGSLEDRLRASQATRPAMYKNSDRLAPLFIPLSTPPTPSVADPGRGTRKRRDALRQQLDDYKLNNSGLVYAEEKLAERVFKSAFASGANTRSHRELRDV